MPKEYTVVTRPIWQRMWGHWKADILDNIICRGETKEYPPSLTLAQTFWSLHSSSPSSTRFHTGRRTCKVRFMLFGRCILERNAPAPAFPHLGKRAPYRWVFLKQCQSACLLQPGPTASSSGMTTQGTQTEADDNQHPN